MLKKELYVVLSDHWKALALNELVRVSLVPLSFPLSENVSNKTTYSSLFIFILLVVFSGICFLILNCIQLINYVIDYVLFGKHVEA